MVAIDIMHQTQHTEILKYSNTHTQSFPIAQFRHNRNAIIQSRALYAQCTLCLRHHRLFNNHQLYSSFKRTSILIRNHNSIEKNIMQWQ